MDRQTLEKEIDRQVNSALEFYRWLERETIKYAAGKIDDSEFEVVLMIVKIRAQDMRETFKPYIALRKCIVRAIGD